jgi:uncharacterized repeat protein (TIGR01451 family)
VNTPSQSRPLARVFRGSAPMILLLLLAWMLVSSVHAATIRGTIRSESLRGTATADRIFGLRGNDKLFGLSGSDLLDGGSGRDLISGGPGGDRLLARDGERDSVQCGPGDDTARVDLRDRVSACETVRRPPTPPPPVQAADLSVALTAPANPVPLNTDLTYLATLTNAGLGTASDVTLSSTLPSGVTYTTASTSAGSCQFVAPAVSCTLGSISPGAAVTVTLVIRVVTGTSVAVTTTVSSATPDANSTNNAATVTSIVSAPPPPPPPPTNCDASYPTVCIPPPPPDLDCGDIPYRNFAVRPPDPHGFDGNNNGIGCET